MGARDWAGTVLVACLVAAADLLRAHTILLVIFCTGAAASAAFIAWDVWRTQRRTRRQHPLADGSAKSILRAIKLAEAADRLLKPDEPPDDEPPTV